MTQLIKWLKSVKPVLTKTQKFLASQKQQTLPERVLWKSQQSSQTVYHKFCGKFKLKLYDKTFDDFTRRSVTEWLANCTWQFESNLSQNKIWHSDTERLPNLISKILHTVWQRAEKKWQQYMVWLIESLCITAFKNAMPNITPKLCLRYYTTHSTSKAK